MSLFDILKYISLPSLILNIYLLYQKNRERKFYHKKNYDDAKADLEFLDAEYKRTKYYEMAKKLVGNAEANFDPKAYENLYSKNRQRLVNLIEYHKKFL